MTTIWPAYEGSAQISWYPVMQVLKTTSPDVVGLSGAPKSHPSWTAPDSSARRPLSMSGLGGRRGGRPREALTVVMHEGTVDQGHQPPPLEPRPEQGRVLGAGTEVRRFHGPFGRRVEEDACRRLADAQPGVAAPPRLAEHPVGPDGEPVHQGGNPVPAHPSEGYADRERQLQSDHPRGRPVVRQRLLLDPM